MKMKQEPKFQPITIVLETKKKLRHCGMLFLNTIGLGRKN